ncbi:MAG TPA: YesL family protein [Bacillales bacterium]|nr:YesL family protein [Bacillales bacterium]
MINQGVIGKIYRIAEWIMLLAYANLLWILFTVVGVFIFGFFPSTVGLYSVVRKWILKGSDIPVWKTFWGAFRSEFIKANLVGFAFLLIGGVIYVDLKFFQHSGGPIFFILSYLFMMILIIYLMMWLFLFPVYVHYELTVLQYIKQTFLIIFLRPLEAVMAIIGGLAAYYLMMLVPGIIPFFSMSLAALVLTWVAQRSFTKITEKSVRIQQEN